jgi:hypothetical protein
MVQYKVFKAGMAETSSEQLDSFLRQNTVVSVEKRFVECGRATMATNENIRVICTQ